MSSSSIEVMSGEGKIDDGMFSLPEEEGGEMNDPLDESENENSEDYGGSLTPIHEAIIFSPQDSMSTKTSKTGRGRGRGRGRGPGIKKNVALTLTLDDGIDYAKINLPVACQVCGKIMASGKILIQHMATHMENKAFQCPHCPKSFTRMVHLQGHLVLHGIQKQFECPVCHQRFSRQDCVRVHMRLHDRSKCVFCNVCHKAFLTHGALNIHMRIHRGEKPFKCHLCGKCFTQKNHVITHIKRHTKIADEPFSKKLGPRMFQCEHCPRSFIRLSDYERHVQWNHGAVADSNIGEKTLKQQCMETDDYSLMDEEFLSPVETLNNKVKKRAFNRKVMCTIGTQTDEDGGHIIIPRQYKNAASMTSSGTQVSAPPTPRGGDDELYENDIFDEGMDRNFSSDEEMDDDGQRSPIHECKVVSYNYSNNESSSNTLKDDAFDEVLGKTKSEKNVDAKQSEGDAGDKDAFLDKEEEKTENTSEDNITTPVESAAMNKPDDSINTDANKPKNTVANKSKNTDANNPKNTDANKLTVINETNENLAHVKTKVSKHDEIKKSSILSINKKPLKQMESKKPLRPIFAAPALSPAKIEPKVIEGEHEPMIRISNKSEVPAFNPERRKKILDTFNTKNWKSKRKERGRGRGKIKSVIGLTGATHLRLIRKSMMNFITEKTEGYNESLKESQFEDEQEQEELEQDEPEYIVPHSDKKLKRQSKLKQHGKDFICNLKTCEICNPSPSKEVKTTIKPTEEENYDNGGKTNTKGDQANTKGDQTNTKGDQTNTKGDQSAKLLQFLISGDISNLKGTDFRLLSDFTTDSSVPPELRDNMSSEMRDISEVHLSGGTSMVERIAEKNQNLSKEPFVSPPVELQAFCIPTYSCKLCGREFRFEGKLHRHIESVHQRKKIFSPDVKPGRGSTRYAGEGQYIMTSRQVESPKAVIAQNPEIEALRSEWDDDDPDLYEPEEKVKIVTSTTLAKQFRPTPNTQKRTPIFINPIVTREIMPTVVTNTDTYVREVKLNINKISGLAEFDEASYKGIDITPISHSVKPNEVVVDTLDTKCRKLLEKLFDNDLLIECGLFEEHVSVVLGRILQHYGVKMIEDYGQGQYEVLKYNLWRLIEWKVTMEQMEEFYTEGKSVEEMMDDIMNGIVPIIAHHEIMQEENSESDPIGQQIDEVPIATTSIDTVVSENQLVLSQVANVLGSQLNLGDGVTQVVLAQDVSPELLQGAHIVTIDPATGQVLSQVTADQVILSNSELGEQIQSINTSQVTSVPVTTIASGSDGTVRLSVQGGMQVNPSMSKGRGSKNQKS